MTKFRFCAVFALTGLFLASGHAFADTVNIEIKDFKFNPEIAKAHVGDTVVFTNKDIVPHTATAKETWDSAAIAKDQSWSVVVKTTGTFDYVCKFHATMKAKLIVE
jgi:plastocyanin